MSVDITDLRTLLDLRAHHAGIKKDAEAALEVGFSDQSHLNRFFRRFVGTTPAAYRRSHYRSRHPEVTQT